MGSEMCIRDRMNATLRQLRDEREARARGESPGDREAPRGDREEQEQLAEAIAASLSQEQRRTRYDGERRRNRAAIDAQRQALEEKDRMAQHAEEQRRRDIEEESRARLRFAEEAIQRERKLVAADKKLDRLSLELIRLVCAKCGRPAPCLLYTSPSPRDGLLSRMPSSA